MKPSQKAGRSQVSPRTDRRGEEPLPEDREGLGCPPREPREVKSLSRRDDRGQSHPRRAWRVRSPFRSTGSDREALAKSQEMLGGIRSPRGGPGGLEALQAVWKGQESLP